MANLVPGFIWHPIDVGNRPKRSKGRGLVCHVAVSESTNLVPTGSVATRNADWHFYLPKSGPGYQYIDLDLQCWASGAGNSSLPAFESQGGLTNTQSEPWTDNQLNLAAQIYAHLHQTEGAPLQLMPNSLPSSRGLGYHRLGINPWRVAGSETWSSSTGKVCPGDAKIAQIPTILARATALVNDTPPEEDVALSAQDIIAIRNAVWNTPFDDKGNIASGYAWASTRDAGVDAKTGRIESKVDALADAVSNLQAAVDSLKSSIPQ